MSKTKKQTFIQGILILMFSQVFVKLLGLIYKLYLTNKEGFGDTGNAIYSSGFQIYALLLTISSVGVPNAVAKLVSEKVSIGDEKGGLRIFKIAFVMFGIIGFVSSTILFMNAKYIAVNLLQIPQAEMTLQALAPAIFFVSVLSVFRGFFNASGDMRPTANSQTIEQLAKTFFTIAIVEYIYMHINVNNKTELMAAGANIATTIATIVCFIYLFMCYKKYKINKTVNCTYKRDKISIIVKNILIVSMPITITAILGTINKNIDSITVVRCLKNFLSEQEATIQYGILIGKVDTLVTLPMSFNMALSTSLVPTISSAKAKNQLIEVNNKIKFSILITILIALPCSVGMIIFANPILKLLFPNASAGTFIYQMSAIAIVFILINQTITAILQGLGKQIMPVFALLVGVILKLIINLILIPIDPKKFILGGTVGASVGTIACYFVAMVINIYILNKNTKIKFNKIDFYIKPIICTTVMIITSWIVFFLLKNQMKEKYATIFSILFAIIVYFVMIITTKTLRCKSLKPLKTQRSSR